MAYCGLERFCMLSFVELLSGTFYNYFILKKIFFVLKCLYGGAAFFSVLSGGGRVD